MTPDLTSIRERIMSRLDTFGNELEGGLVKQVANGTLVAELSQARLGDVCLLRLASGEERLGEVTGISGKTATISTFSDLRGLCNVTRVIPTYRQLSVRVGRHLLGQALDAFGNTSESPEKHYRLIPVVNRAPRPMDRRIIEDDYTTGIRVIDTMLTVGRGQRVGIFGGAGLGKSTLVSMLVNNSQCDVAVVGLVGERGREVREFWDKSIRPDIKARSVLVSSTSDSPAIERRLAALTATAVAEGFRDAGLNVLLVVDSLTRVARAQREIGLAAGEPPSRRGFPPSTSGLLAELVERAGPDKLGTITAFYTVLVEGEFDADPVAEELKALLDGHIILSQKHAEAGQYPSIDVLASKSRLQPKLVGNEHRMAADRIRSLMAKFRDVELLLQIGEYQQGSDAMTDEAIEKHDQILKFFSQRESESADPQSAINALIALAEHG